MKGLLIKDLKLIQKHTLSIIIVAAFFFLITAISSQTFFALYSAFMFSIIPITTMAYDESYKWNKYETVLPIKKSAIVMEKYLLVFVLIIPITLIESIIMYFMQDISIQSTLNFACVMLFYSLLSPAVGLPIIFRFGYLKGRFITVIIIAVMTATLVILQLKSITSETTVRIQFSMQNYVAVIGIVLIIISFVISNLLYRKKEL